VRSFFTKKTCSNEKTSNSAVKTQIPRLGSKFRGLQKAVRPNDKLQTTVLGSQTHS